MYCNKCGVQIPEGNSTCPQCGETNQIMDEETFSAPERNQADGGQQIQENTQSQKWKKRKLLIICASVLVVACAVLVPVLIENARSNRYEAAIALMDSGDVEEAQEAFVELGEYQESAELVKCCQNMMDYDAANELMKSGNYVKAQKAFIALGSYKKADTLAQDCQNIMDYNAAVEMMEVNDNENARDAFLLLGAYEDCADRAAECQNRIDYDKAEKMMGNQDFAAAVVAFEALDDYSDAEKFAVECQNIIDYAAAEAAYDEGEFYTAKLMFEELGWYSDASACALACIQTPPETKELYRNEDYASRRCSITFYGPKDDDSIFTLVKIYTKDDVLVSTLFIAADEKIKIKIPRGEYKMKKAMGWEWYGMEEMFGDQAYYEVLLFEDSSEITKISSSYYYTIRFSVDDGNVTGRQEDREDF